MSAYPISVNSEVDLKLAIEFMANKGIGNLIVYDDYPKGVFTERDMLQSIASEGTLSQKRLGQIGYQPFHKISPDTTILEAAHTMISKKKRLLVFNNEDNLVGIITASDMLRAFRKTTGAPSLKDVISHNVYQCTTKASILDAINVLHHKGIGSVVVSDVPNYGIFTERDLLRSLLKRVALNDSIDGHYSKPLIAAEIGIDGKEAAGIMASKNIKRLGIEEEKSLVGMITARDIVDVFQSHFIESNPYIQDVRT